MMIGMNGIRIALGPPPARQRRNNPQKGPRDPIILSLVRAAIANPGDRALVEASALPKSYRHMGTYLFNKVATQAGLLPPGQRLKGTVQEDGDYALRMLASGVTS